ncbi:hypothetical protein HaLaN_05251, partial [Haematococcus lacustris]
LTGPTHLTPRCWTLWGRSFSVLSTTREGPRLSTSGCSWRRRWHPCRRSVARATPWW